MLRFAAQHDKAAAKLTGAAAELQRSNTARTRVLGGDPKA